jgi:site-specific recombinase XerD
MSTVGQVLFSFFEDHLKVQKGLRPGSIKSYRDTMKLFLAFVARACRKPVTRLAMADLSSQRVLDFLQMIELERHNKPQTRNQRLAALHTFYRYLATHHCEMLAEAERVEAIPKKRTSPAETRYLEHDEVEQLFQALAAHGSRALRDRALLMRTGTPRSRCEPRWLPSRHACLRRVRRHPPRASDGVRTRI